MLIAIICLFTGFILGFFTSFRAGMPGISMPGGTTPLLCSILVSLRA